MEALDAVMFIDVVNCIRTVFTVPLCLAFCSYRFRVSEFSPSNIHTYPKDLFLRLLLLAVFVWFMLQIVC